MLCSIGPAAFSIEYVMLGVQGKAKLYNHSSLKMNWPVWPKLQECTCFQDAFTGFLEFLHTDVLQTYEKQELLEALAWIKLTDMQNAEAWNKPKVSVSFVGLWWTRSGLENRNVVAFLISLSSNWTHLFPGELLKWMFQGSALRLALTRDPCFSVGMTRHIGIALVPGESPFKA